MHMLEHVMIKGLAHHGVDVDLQATLLFKSRADTRDERPLVYPLRIIRPCGAVIDQDVSDEEKDGQAQRPIKRIKKNMAGKCWQGCQLITMGRTAEAEQVPGMKLKMVEDLTESALPTLNDDRYSTVRGSKRYEQLGVDACTKILESLLEADKPPADVQAFILLDLSPGVGDFFWAWLSRVKAMKMPVFHIAVTPSAVEAEWLNHTIEDELAMKLVNGSLTLPGFTARSTEPPPEMLTAKPDIPQLNLCTYTGGTLLVPQPVIQQWATHGTFGDAFQEKVKAIVDEFGEPVTETKTDEQRDAMPNPSPPKKLCEASPMETMPVAQLPSANLAEGVISLTKKDLAGKLFIRVAQDGTWWLLNNSDASCSIPAANILAGFGSGQFKHIPRGAEGKPGAVTDEAHMVLFHLTGSTSLVVHNGKLCNLQELITAAASSRKDPEVCYHKLLPCKDGFTLERKHDVYWKCTPKVVGQNEPSAEDPSKLKLQGTDGLAGLFSVQKLKFERGHCKLLWGVKWQVKGLMPNKPYIVLCHEMKIAGNTAVKL